MNLAAATPGHRITRLGNGAARCLRADRGVDQLSWLALDCRVYPWTTWWWLIRNPAALKSLRLMMGQDHLTYTRKVRTGSRQRPSIQRAEPEQCCRCALTRMH